MSIKSSNGLTVGGDETGINPEVLYPTKKTIQLMAMDAMPEPIWILVRWDDGDSGLSPSEIVPEHVKP